MPTCTGAMLILAMAVAGALPRFAAAEAPRLNVYNWSDYIAPDTIANFEAETGIKVTYDVYDGNEVLEAKLLAGQSGYDVVVPSASPFWRARSPPGSTSRSTRRRCPTGKTSTRASSLAAAADPGNAHGVPYLWSVTGIGYNGDGPGSAGRRRADSWALLFDPANAKKLAACGISLLDTPQEVFPAALAYLGRDPKSRDPGDLDKAVAALEKIRPYIRKFHSSEYINDLANGDMCLSLGYSGDV